MGIHNARGRPDRATGLGDGAMRRVGGSDRAFRRRSAPQSRGRASHRSVFRRSGPWAAPAAAGERAEARAPRDVRGRAGRAGVVQPARTILCGPVRVRPVGRQPGAFGMHCVRTRAMGAGHTRAPRRPRRGSTGAGMIYDDYLTQAELQRWIADADVSWGRIDVALALTQPHLLDQIRDSALIESYFPIYTTRLMRALWDQIDATAVFSIQLYESYKHFYVLNRYLQAVEYRPITPDEILEVRRRNLDAAVDDGIGELARYMFSEHFAAYYFLRLSRHAAEPVLREIAGFIARDEFRHTQFAYDLLEPRVTGDPATRERVLRAAIQFTHLGADVVALVPGVEQND